MIGAPIFLLAWLAASPVAEADRLAEASLQATEPEAALTLAQRALAASAEFDATAFVTAGRKGEVVEDAFLQARTDYRRHRARLYEVIGVALARLGRHQAAVRHLDRALLLDPPETPCLPGVCPAAERLQRQVSELVALGRGKAAVDLIRAHSESFASQGALVERTADAAGLPSAQAELDRARLQAIAGARIEVRDGPFSLPTTARQSDARPLRLAPGVVVVYVAPRACGSCSADLEAIKRAATPGTRVLVISEVPDEDQALRRVLDLYRYDYPLLMGIKPHAALGVEPGEILVVARAGWVHVHVSKPFSVLAAVLAVFDRDDLRETPPRPSWNRQPVDRSPAAAPPGLLPEGLAPGEDLPAPAAFLTAVEAYAKGRPGEALRLFESLEKAGDGWLLPGEARFDRALCLAALGQREAARALLLRTGDSRFQDAVDGALERIGSKRR